MRRVFQFVLVFPAFLMIMAGYLGLTFQMAAGYWHVCAKIAEFFIDIAAPPAAAQTLSATTPSGVGVLSTQNLYWNLTSGMAPGVYFGQWSQTVMTGSAPAGVGVWNQFDSIVDNSTGAYTNLVSHYSQMVRLPGRPTPGRFLENEVLEGRDNTGLPSSKGGGLSPLEIDVAANGEDDANMRIGLQIDLVDAEPGAGARAECGICFWGAGSGDEAWMSVIQMDIGFVNAAIDLRGAPHFGPGDAVDIWMPTGYKINLDNAGTNGASNVSIKSSGTALVVQGIVSHVTFNKSTLPACGVATAASDAWVSDATSTASRANYTGGGTSIAHVECAGLAWVVI